MPWMALKEMFGFIFTQPIHKTPRQMRLATIALLYVSVDMMYRLIDMLGTAISMEQTIAAVGVLAAAIFATIWKGIQNLTDVHKDDD